MRDFQFLQEQAYQYLRGKILNDELEPEQVYSESQVARELNCSRTPVKDALTRLSHAKYIDIIPSRGFRLHQMTEEDLVSTFQTRVAVESFCALSIMERRDRPDGQDALAHLHELLQKQEQASERSDLAAFLEADILFHRTIMLFFRTRTSPSFMSCTPTALRSLRGTVCASRIAAATRSRSTAP